MGALRTFIDANIRLSNGFDKLLPAKFRVDGNRHFVEHFSPRFLSQGQHIYDIGGGKNPYISIDKKQELGLTVTALDIQADEMARAPVGAYDKTVCADISRYQGEADADLVICQALLEHVKDVGGAFEAIASMLKPGGRALIFVPSRNAVFARLNILLPQKIKERILFAIYPQTCRNQGFVSYYDRCTPKAFRALATRNGLVVEAEEYYFVSSYFRFFFPAYLLWRAWLLGFHAVAGNQAAETFSMALRKTEEAQAKGPAMPTRSD